MVAGHNTTFAAPAKLRAKPEPIFLSSSLFSSSLSFHLISPRNNYNNISKMAPAFFSSP